MARHTHRPCAADSWGLGLLLTLEDLRLAREVELAESESSQSRLTGPHAAVLGRLGRRTVKAVLQSWSAVLGTLSFC